MYSAKNERAISEVVLEDHQILDIGCGTGATAKEIKSSFPQATIRGISFSSEELKVAAQHLDDAIQADLNTFDFTSLETQFDLIICSHVLEHLVDPIKLLDQLAPLLSNRGRILVLVPNFGHWPARWMVLRGKFEYQDHGLMDRTHLRFFTLTSLEPELVPNTLKVRETIKNGHFPLPKIRKHLPSKLVSKLDSWAMKYLPNLLCYEIGLVLEKR